jgi:phage recombination protein Bet
MAQKATAVATAPAPLNRNNGLMATFAAKYNVDADKMKATMKATCFRTQPGKPEVSDEQLMALIIVANQYGLNPFTKEIYAFPDKGGGIVPVVSIDGWIRIINERPELDSIEFVDAPAVEGVASLDWIETAITRKDRAKPIRLKEYFAECVRGTDPWKSHPRRMLRHKSLIQCARVAFGFAGIYDPDEAERIAAAIDVTPANAKPKTEAPRARTDAQAPIQGESTEVPQNGSTQSLADENLTPPEDDAGARG